MSIRKAILGPLWLLSAGVFVTAVSLLILKVCEDSNRSRERGHLVASIVHEQAVAFQQENISDKVLDDLDKWPDDFLSLKNWVVIQTWRTGDPGQVSHRLRLISNRHSYSPVLRTSLRRWSEALTRWASESDHPEQMSPDELIQDARHRYFEASGYQKIGRQYDAAVLYLWSAAFLNRFVQTAPDDSRVPEALFILGEAYLRLQHALPTPIRSDRILNLCSELYPDSIWASRADALWKDEVSAAPGEKI